MQDDPAGNCLYSVFGGERTVLVWPFGYTAHRDGDAAVVRNAAGTLVARTGEQVSLGGGGGEASLFGGVSSDPGACGAQQVWIVAP